MNEREIARRWYGRVAWVQHGHYLSALHFSRRHWRMGALNVALAAAIGTSVFATIAEKADLLVLTGALSVVAALVSALQTFLSYGERADRHRMAGARYGAVGREFELMLSRAEFRSDGLDKLREKLDTLAQECPHIPDAVHASMEREPHIGIDFAREAHQGAADDVRNKRA